MATIAERVAKGAAFLDEHEPGWDQRIHLGKLNIGSSCNCVLGQLYKGFGAGLQATGIADDEYNRDTELGFFWIETPAPVGEDGEPTGEIGALTAEWRRVIKARRSA